MVQPLILTVNPRGKPGIFIGKIEGTDFRLTASRNPMLAAARSLLYVGADPATVLILRDAASSIDRLSGRLDVIVKKMARKGQRKGRTAVYGGRDYPL